MSTKWRGRLSGSAHDNDLYANLRLRGGNPRSDDWSYSLFGRGTWDIDGRQDSNNDAGFFSITDTHDRRVDGRLYRAHLDLRGGSIPADLPINRVRVGRQSADIGAIYHLFDGISLVTEPATEFGDLEFSVFGGSPVRFSESSRTGDWLAGGMLRGSFTSTLCSELEYTHVRERLSGFANRSGNFSSNYLRVGLSYDDRSTWNCRAGYALLDGRMRNADLQVAVTLDDLGTRLFGDVVYFAKVGQDQALEFDPYFGTLGAHESYLRLSLRVETQASGDIVVSEGIEARQLLDENDEGPFNHEYLRAFVTLSITDWPLERIDLNFTGEQWNAEGDDTTTAGLDLLWRPSDDIDTSIGTYYSLYKLDLFTASERQRVQAYFIRMRRALGPSTRFDATYELEKAGDDTFHTASLSLTYSF